MGIMDVADGVVLDVVGMSSFVQSKICPTYAYVCSVEVDGEFSSS